MTLPTAVPVATELMRLDVLVVAFVLVFCIVRHFQKSSFGFPRAPRGRDTHKTGIAREIFPALPLPSNNAILCHIGTLRDTS